MKKLFFQSLVLCAVGIVFFGAAKAQSNADKGPENVVKKGSSSVRSDGANPIIIIVGSAAKAGWVTTKFAANHLLKPAAKTIFLKAAPAVTKFALKKSAKHLIPVAIKFAAL